MVRHGAGRDAAVAIRAERASDAAAIQALTGAAFEGRYEVEVLAALRPTPAFVPELSLVAEEAESRQIVGHVLLSRVDLEPAAAGAVLALGPMSVRPDRQRQGIGSRLVARALAEARRLGFDLVVVLGHPAFYPRFGFEPARPRGIEPPQPWPDAAWMALALSPAGARLRGTIRYPAGWRLDAG